MMLFILILVLLLGLIFGGLHILESTVLSEDKETSQETSLTITRDGVDYFPRQDITVIMALGIDELGPVKSSESYRNDAEADAIVLLILDQKDESYTMLCLNRDMMVKMPALGLSGRPAGSYYGQLALSHTYGEGLADSCENTRNTISDLFHGINIDHYLAMNMEGIIFVNDALGGVTVTIEDDFSQVDSSMNMGEMTLMGEQALHFVQSRRGVGNQLNISRMKRQEQYMQGMMNALNVKLEQEDSFVIDLYEQVSDYMVTDCSVNVISGLLQRCSEYTLKEIVSPVGENVLGERHYEFYADEEKLDELALRLFYSPK